MSQMTRFEAGLQLGPSLSWLRGNKAIDGTDALLGPAAGLSLQYNTSSVFGIRLGAGYQEKGYSSDVTFTDINGNTIGSGTVRYELHYLSIPLMLRFGFGEKVRVTAGAGGYAGVLMSGQLTSKGFDLADQTVTDDFENLDLGICASIAGSFPLGAHFGLNTEVRYDKGLTNISALPVVDDGSIRTNAVSLLVGCSYRFGKAI
ncbi:MAG: PorT family protein [Flavobacteriales bacterium]|nr:MAG: PorT family protein [Flavobacteriales bacterium]